MTSAGLPSIISRARRYINNSTMKCLGKPDKKRRFKKTHLNTGELGRVAGDVQMIKTKVPSTICRVACTKGN